MLTVHELRAHHQPTVNHLIGDHLGKLAVMMIVDDREDPILALDPLSVGRLVLHDPEGVNHLMTGCVLILTLD